MQEINVLARNIFMADGSETPIRIARHQLGTALSLFLRNKDPLSVQALACRGSEVIERIAQTKGVVSISTHIIGSTSFTDTKALRKERNLYWNAIKHYTRTDRSDPNRDDDKLMASFTDQANDVVLFLGWWDYQAITKRLPVEAQVFQVWWYGINDKDMYPGEMREKVRTFFPNIMADDRAQQKRCLNRMIEKQRQNKEVLADERTEFGPLMLSNWCE